MTFLPFSLKLTVVGVCGLLVGSSIFSSSTIPITTLKYIGGHLLLMEPSLKAYGAR